MCDGRWRVRAGQGSAPQAARSVSVSVRHRLIRDAQLIHRLDGTAAIHPSPAVALLLPDALTAYCHRIPDPERAHARTQWRACPASRHGDDDQKEILFAEIQFDLKINKTYNLVKTILTYSLRSQISILLTFVLN